MPDIENFRPIPKDYQWAVMAAPAYGVIAIALGYVSGNQITDIRATIERLPDGSWIWNLYDTSFRGNEPSANLAKAAVKKHINYIKTIQTG
ncbi:MAG: hypothetical protein ABFD76_05110 [Smithella sp.]